MINIGGADDAAPATRAAPHSPLSVPDDESSQLDALTLDELRDRVRELYDAQRGVERERDALRDARAAFEVERQGAVAENESALHRSEQRLRAIFETSPDFVKVMAPDGALLEINEAGVAMFEADSLAQLKEQRLLELMLPEYRDAFLAMHAGALAGVPGMLEFEVTTLRGTRRWLETHATGMHDATYGTPVVLSICRDISRQKQARQELQRSQAILRNMSIASPLGLLIIDDRTGAVLYFNHRCLELFAVEHLHDTLQRGELTSHELMSACAAIMVEPERVKASCVTLTDSGNAAVVEDEIACLGDRILRRYSTQIFDDAGAYQGRFYIFEDISARRAAEQERLRLEAQLHQAMKMQSVGRLAGGVAHDFNNMLGVILGHAEVAMREVTTRDPVHADLVAIHTAAERSARLTRQLLAFASKQTAAPTRIDLNDVIGSSLRMLKRLISEDVRLRWQPEPAVWPIRIDPSQLDQILTNLCVNARDAIANVGTITIATANCVVEAPRFAGNPDARAGEFVRLTVSDDGCGMDAAMVAQIFEPFFTTKRVGMGTGLGLATVYGTVKQNDGFIAVDSTPGRGTTFEIYLPRLVGEPDEARTEASPPAAPRGRETVLVVEDEPAILTLVTHILKGQGYDVLRAGTPREALQIARTHRGTIHLLLTDVIMPEMNGRDLAQALLAVHPDIRALFMSGYTADVIAKHGVLDDNVAFLHKPFSIAALSARVRDTIDRDRT